MPLPKKLCFWLIYVAVTLVSILGSIELASRYLFGDVGALLSKQSTEMTYDPVVGWRAKRNYSAEVRHGKYPAAISVQTNSDGFRDSDWSRKLARATRSGATKILLVGDSLLYGWASATDERVSEQLAALYALDGAAVEIFNAGIPGYGPPHQLRLLSELLERINPDVVILIFCENDYGDTALPYDHRNPYRVYKPFYAVNGDLLLNETIPRRPSLLMNNVRWPNFYIWYAVDVAYYFAQDISYKAYDIPNPLNAPGYPMDWRTFDYFIYDEWLKERFPQVEQTVMALYEQMNGLVGEHAGQFFVAASRERLEYVIQDALRERSIAFISAPSEEMTYWRWEEALYDHHPNFLWAWFIANRIYGEIEGKSHRSDLADLPQLPQVPLAIDFSNDARSARYLFGDWRPSEEAGRWLGRDGAVLLRNPVPSSAQVTLEITGFAHRRQAVDVIDHRNLIVCQFELEPIGQTLSCPADAANSGPLLFFQFIPQSLEPHPTNPDDESLGLRSAFFEYMQLQTESLAD